MELKTPNKKIFNLFTVGDLVLIGLLLFVSLLSFVGMNHFITGQGSKAVVWRDGIEYARLDLNQEQIVPIKGPLGITILEIKQKQVTISQAPCVHKICMKMGPIHKPPQMIVCIPNRIVVKIVSSQNQHSFDVVTE